jgi:hypothetical protein
LASFCGPPLATAPTSSFDPVEGVGLHDPQLVVQVQAEALELIVDDLLGALVALDAFTGEDLHVDDGALRALVHAQRGVLHVGGLLAEDRAQQLLFRGQRGSPFGVTLPTSTSPGFTSAPM